MILGIETATPYLSIALASDGAIAASFTVNRKNSHDELLVPLMETLQDAAGHPVLSAVAVSAGPGSFTGLRIGMAAAKGMALALDIPIVLVPTFEAMAWRVARLGLLPAGARVLTLFDGRAGDIYASEYEMIASGYRQLRPPRACTAAELAATMEPGAWLAGDGAMKLLHEAPDAFRLLPDFASIAHADAVALLGAEMLARGEIADTDSCEPFYLRDFRTTVPKPLAG
jgi:tRNA threonylcarbamoyladenosine biosynthesis protein TsaB